MHALRIRLTNYDYELRANDPMVQERIPTDLDEDLDDVERDQAAISAAFRRSLKVIAILAAVAAGAFWWLTRPDPPPAVRASAVELPQLRAKPRRTSFGAVRRDHNGSRCPLCA